MIRRGGVVGSTPPAILITRRPKMLATQGQPLPAHQALLYLSALGLVCPSCSGVSGV